MLKDLSAAWQAAFREMWTAFCAGSVPVGAVLCDTEGNIIMSDHNRNSEPQTINRRIAHAEANILRNLDTSKYNPRSLTLYTTMEPCPMCMGTALMSNIKKIRSAARDSYCGMAHLLDTDPYYAAKGVDLRFEGGEAEQVQLTVQGYYELRYMEQGAGGNVFAKFAGCCPSAAKSAKILYESKWLDEAAAAGKDFGEVFDRIVTLIVSEQKDKRA
ncbi:MAG: nucleoside deaminase [Ruminococcus sp.]|nr:nucleoside deaminase [Ruminococcus sp.]